MVKYFFFPIIFALFLFSGTALHGGEEVVFEDISLENAVREIKNRPDGPIHASDISHITELDLGSRNIITLGGMEYFTALEDLNLRDNFVQDVTPLSQLIHLYRLNLRNNAILALRDIHFDTLKELPNLRELSLRHNRGIGEDENLRLSDISILQDFQQLEWIGLRDNYISDISVFAHLPNLHDLNLRENLITDLSPLSGLTNLQGPGSRLYIEDNLIVDYSPIYHYAHLIETADFDYLLAVNIPDSDLEQAVRDTLTALQGEIFIGTIYWSDLKNITILDLRDLRVRNLEGLQYASNLEELNIRDNGITNEIFDALNLHLLAELENLRYLNIRGNELTSLGEDSPLRLLTQLEFLSMRDNFINDIGALQYLVNLKDLNARNNQITDLTPLSGLQNLTERLYLSGNDGLTDFSPIAHYYHLIEDTDFIIPPEESAGPVYINEVMASNGSTIADEDGDYEDWIELYNSGDTAYDLSGCYLSDDETNLTKWQFPQGVTIQAQGYLIIWASGKNRTFWPGQLHTNFSISAAGEPVILTAPDGTTIIDYMPPVSMERDQSYGRYPDGGDEWYYYTNPTPGQPNPTPPPQPMEPPVFSQPGGWYDASFSLTLHSGEGIVRYTLDGSEPTASSPIYSGPITIQNRTGEPNDLSTIRTNNVYHGDERWREPVGSVFKGTVVRARVFQSGWLPSETVTHSYFIDPLRSERYSFSTVSISTPRENFFDNNIGIYVYGYHNNYFQRGDAWEREAHMEFFEKDGALAFSQGIGVRIHGGTSRSRPIKALRIYARADYGKSWFEYQLFADKDIHQYKRFLLRNSGNDWNQSYFRDAFMQSLLKDFDLDIQYYRPVIVFLNGEYWGIHNTRDRLDQYYIETHYGIEEDEFVMLEMLQQNGAVHSRGKPSGQDHYHDMIDYISQNGAVSSSSYDHISTMMDMDNFIDYNIAHIFFMNTDWPGNNSEFWRYIRDNYDPSAPPGKDGRWRWIVFDLDFGFGLNFSYIPGHGQFAAHNTLAFATEPNGPNWPNPPVSTFLLRQLLENETFRNSFINRFADYMNTCFESSHMQSIIEEFRQNLEPEMLEHHKRWYGTDSLSAWYNDMNRMNSFAAQRPGYQRNHIVEYFNLPGSTEITLEAVASGMGTFRINTLDLTEELDSSGSWSGIYFQGVPLTIEAVPFPGYIFTGWEGYPDADHSLEMVPSQGELTLRGYFAPDVHFLSQGPYLLNHWSSEVPAGTYPSAMVFKQSERKDPGLHDPMTHYYTLPYNNEARTRILGLHSDGFAFINTGANDFWHEGADGRDLGASTLSLNTEGVGNIYLGFRAGTVIPHDRSYGIQVQYRIGNEGAFTTLTDQGIPVIYVRNEQAGHNRYFGPISLPGYLVNQELVQIRWKYYHISGTSGPRAMLRLNDIIVTSAMPHYPDGLVINEILWENHTLDHPIYLDEDGTPQPFAELYNSGEEEVFLGGYHLSPFAHSLSQWTFPDITLESGQYLRIWLSGKNRSHDVNNLHTRFRANPLEPEIYLTHFDGTTIIDQAPAGLVPAVNHSVGRSPDGNTDWITYEQPTPGYSNSFRILDAPSFSPQAGTYSDPLTVTIINPYEEAVILYTLDGSDPWKSTQVIQGGAGENVLVYLEKGTILTIQAKLSHLHAIPSYTVSAHYMVEGVLEPPELSHPGGGYFFQPVDITLTTNTAGARIRYTPDGSNPFQSPTAITSEPGEAVNFTLLHNSHTLIRAYTLLPGWEDSSEASAEYHVSRKIDGLFNDWAETELREDSAAHNPWTEPHNLAGLWVGWDQAFLYIGMSGRVNDQNRLSTYLCLDSSKGITNLDNSRYSQQGNAFNISASGFGVEYAFETDGSIHGIWHYSQDNDMFNNITSQGRVSWTNEELMNSGYEAAIPWNKLFEGLPQGQIVPENLTIRLISNLQNNNTSHYYASDDIIPALNRETGNYSPGQWHAVPEYIEIGVDSSGNGKPDMAPVIRFILDMEDYEAGLLQVRGNASFLTWQDEAPVMEHLSGSLYQWSHILNGTESGVFEYKFTNTIGGTRYWSPPGDNLQHHLIPGEDNLIQWTWDNTEVPRRVAEPEFSLESGEYNETQDIYLFNSTAGAVIHYTTDGTDPRTSPTVFIGEPGETIHFSLVPGTDMVIRAYASRSEWMDSEVVSAHYIIHGQQLFFPDPGLEAAVRNAIALPYGPIYAYSILQVTELDGESMGIQSLAGIHQLENLEILILRDNNISSLEPLSSLDKLTVLDLRGNQITDLTPLSSLTSLVNLNLRDNQITCIEPLQYLVNLVELRLHTNMISDISALQYLTGLEYLSMRANHISDISVLAYLAELRDLNLRDNLVENISPLGELTKLLDRLYLSGNPNLTDFSPIYHYYHQIAEVDFEIQTVVRQWYIYH